MAEQVGLVCPNGHTLTVKNIPYEDCEAYCCDNCEKSFQNEIFDETVVLECKECKYDICCECWMKQWFE